MSGDEHETEGRAAVLARAAANAEVYLICHVDTWNHIAYQSGSGPNTLHFNPPTEEQIVPEGSARVRVPVSGRTLTTILNQMIEDAASEANSAVDRAMGAHVRDSISAALEAGDTLPFIIIDPHPDDDEVDDMPDEDEETG